MLNGLITADAISTAVVVKKKKSNKVTTRLGSRLLNLTVAGNAIPVNVAPNTKLDLAGVGTLVINEQVKQRWGG